MTTTDQREALDRAAALALQTTDTAELLTKAYHLTHRINRSLTQGSVDELRAMRDLITAEIIRRTTKGA